jgi:hypothetical protein
MIRKLLKYPFLPAYIIAVIIFYLSYGFNVINPTNVNWLMSQRLDWGAHYLGWAYFREEAWTFPLGAIENYTYPLGNNIGYTDSIPLLALLLKPFNALLPNEFQYFGLWLLFCYLLVAHYTLKIVNLYAVKQQYALIIVTIVVANPALWYRGIHPALCLHGFILAGIYLYLKPSTVSNVNTINWQQVLLLSLAAVIHPYIWAIIIGFNFVIPLKNSLYDKTLSLGRAVVYPVSGIVISFFLWIVIGLIDFKGGQSFAAKVPFETPFNLNSLYNSWGLSPLFPELSKGSITNYESFMYLGLGLFIVILIAIVHLAVSKDAFKSVARHKRLVPLLVLMIVMSVFAVSNKAMIGDTILYNIKLPEALLFVGKVFRASARFFWPAYYLIILFFTLLFVKNKVFGKATMAVLLMVFALQAYDLSKLFSDRTFASGTFDTPFDDQNWEANSRDFDNIIVYMPFSSHYVSFGDWQDLAYLALKNHKPITVGNSARENTKGAAVFIDSLTHAIENDLLSKRNLYVTTPDHLDLFSLQLYSGKLKVNYLDGFYLLHAPGRNFIIKNPTAQATQKTDSVNRRYSQKSILKEFTVEPGKEIQFNLETFSTAGNVVMARGWAFIKDSKDNTGDSIFMTIKKGAKTYVTPINLAKRPDLISAFNKKSLENSGFVATVHTDLTENDALGLAIKTNKGEWAYTSLGKKVVKNDFPEPIKLSKLPLRDKEQAGNIDEFTLTSQHVLISGWSVLKTKNSVDQTLQVVLKSAGKIYAFNVVKVMRPDVTQFLKGLNYDTSGFKLRIAKESIDEGTYKVGLLVKDNTTGKESLLMTDREAVVR